MTEFKAYTPGEVALLFHVDPKTASRWAKAGELGGFKTPGGQWRFVRAVVDAYLEGKELTHVGEA